MESYPVQEAGEAMNKNVRKRAYELLPKYELVVFMDTL